MTVPGEQAGLSPEELRAVQQRRAYEDRLEDINAKWRDKLRGFEPRGDDTFVYGMGVDKDDRVVTVLHGELDSYTCISLEEAVGNILAAQQESAEASGGATVVFDAADLKFLDSCGLRAILNSQDRVSEAGNRFLIGNPSVEFTRLLDITSLTDMFEYEQSDSQ